MTDETFDTENGSQEISETPRFSFSRRVTLRTTQRTSPVVLETNAATYGQLIEDIGNIDAGIVFRGTSCSIMETANTVTGANSVLPEGEFTLMQFPSKNDNG